MAALHLGQGAQEPHDQAELVDVEPGREAPGIADKDIAMYGAVARKA